MIPLCTPDLSGNESAYLQECIATGFVSSAGPFVPRFEEQVAAFAGAPAAVATASGTSALHLALHVSGVQQGDLVIAPSLTFIATANAIAHCGATPWLADVCEGTWNIDPQVVASMLAEECTKTDGALLHRQSGRRVAAIVAVHNLNCAADLDALHAIARSAEIPLIADGAATLGAQSGGRPLGSLADLTAYSFNGNKTATCGGGGALVGTDRELLSRAAHLASTARTSPHYDHDAVGFNYRMTNLEAAVGCAQLERLPLFLSRKRSIRKRYDQAFSQVEGLESFPTVGREENACWLSGVLIPEDASMKATDLCEALQAQKIGARTFWKPIHHQLPFASAPRTAMKVTDALWSRVLTLPSSTHLNATDQAKVIDSTIALIASHRSEVSA